MNRAGFVVRETLAAGLLLSLAACDECPRAADESQLGRVEFAISCNPEAQATFNVAVAWLHSFEYERAEAAFREAAERDMACAMPYWGMAMSLFHPLWMPPQRTGLERGSEFVQRAQALGPGSEREEGYVRAIGAFYLDFEELSHRQRALAYEQAMAELHASHPKDREATIFYALALLATALPMDKTFENQLKAGALLEAVLDSEPDHPGTTHYIIHSYDYPELAERALGAARSYAEIAPASAHANHMPSHIFTRLGLWQESIATNLNAAAAGRAFARERGWNGRWDEEIHAVSYLIYAYLQIGQDAKAKEILEDVQGIESVEPVGLKAAYPIATAPVRYALERQRWSDAAALRMQPEWFPWEDYPQVQALTYFARALGAARMGDTERAKRDLRALQELRRALSQDAHAYWSAQLKVQDQAAQAWIAQVEGREEEALALMRSAADLEDAGDKLPVTPGEVVPARELLADLLLDQRRNREALAEYEAVLGAAPNRFNALYGAGTAAERLGDKPRVRVHYEQLVAQSSPADGHRPSVDHARDFLSQPVDAR